MEDNLCGFSITSEEFMSRWKQVFNMVEQNKYDLFIAYGDDRATHGAANIRWLVDIPVHFEPSIVVFIPSKKEPIVLTGPECVEYFLMIGRCKDVRAIKELTLDGEDYPFSKIDKFTDILSQYVQMNKIRRIGFVGLEMVGYKLYKKLRKEFGTTEWIDADTKFMKLRMIKSIKELEIIKYAYSIAFQGLQVAIDTIKPGIMEREVAAETEYTMKKMGAEGVGIDTIVASGENNKNILARNTLRKIERNDIVCITVAPRFMGYHGCYGLPVFLGNIHADIEKALHAAILANKLCFEAIKVGTKGRFAEKIARDVMNTSGFGEGFLYSGIHSVGMVEFESPIFGPSSEFLIENNMVLSVDIPVFNLDFGGFRIENGGFVNNGKLNAFNNMDFFVSK